jgi:hypothetical protein
MFKLNPLFKLRTEVTPGILALLQGTVLGTKGAKYKHLDTSKRIYEADNPLFLSVERAEKTLGNVTFCRRGEHWYIRYFAFQSNTQSSENKKRNQRKNSVLKQELNSFFQQVLKENEWQEPVKSFYAYIDPKNEKSKWMSESFGFQTIAQLATQSFSRVNPQKSNRLTQLSDWNEIAPIIRGFYGENKYYFETHCSKPPFFVLKNAESEIIACAKAVHVNWEIVRLPGKMGSFLTKTIPFIPFLRKLIRPKKHHFLVPEIVWTKNNDSDLLTELFESILADQKLNLILWWTDLENPLYQHVQSEVKWGLLNTLIGVSLVDVVQLKSATFHDINKQAVFVTANDMV